MARRSAIPQLQLDFSPPPGPLVPPSNPTPVAVQYEDAATSNWPSEQHAPESAPHDPWAKWPIDPTAAPDRSRELFKLLAKANDCNRNHRTFELAVDLWLACLERFEPGAEERYLATVRQLEPQAVTYISHGFGVLLQHFFHDGGYYDVLGDVYMQVRSEWAGSKLGQFFTPWDLCLMLARMQIQGPELEAKIAAREPITVNDPACGSGAMLLAAKACVADRFGRSAARLVRCYGQDIDETCCKMARIQLRMVDERWMRDWQICTAADLARQYRPTKDLLGSATT